MDNVTLKCSRCGLTKAANQFYKIKRLPAKRLHRDYYCKPCRSEDSRARRAVRSKKDPEWEARRSRKRWDDMTAEERYFRRISKPSQRGLSREQFYEMFEAQGGACAICLDRITLIFGSPVSFVVDHCHATGRNRGILCPKCNLGLGHFDDDKARLERAARYLNE